MPSTCVHTRYSAQGLLTVLKKQKETCSGSRFYLRALNFAGSKSTFVVVVIVVHFCKNKDLWLLSCSHNYKIQVMMKKMGVALPTFILSIFKMFCLQL